jgi:hypothetical protein
MLRSIALAAVTIVGASTFVEAGVPAGAGDVPIRPNRRLPVAPTSGDLTGTVAVAGSPAAGWSVDLYAASPDGATKLASTTSDDAGGFRFGRTAEWSGANLYVLALRDAEARLLALLGQDGEAPASIVVNERTTIASIWAAAQFLDGVSITGNAVGLRTAARNVPNLVDLHTGELGAVVQNQVNGTRTNTLATLNTLASLLSDCIDEGCPELYPLATPPGETTPSAILQAFGNVARNPWHNVVPIFELRPPADPDENANRPAFLPTLLWAPTAWTLSLVHTDGGFQAPGEISIDQQGDVWSNNNFMPGSQSILFRDGFPGVVT